MKGIILAAGQGTRIRSAHGDHPKCLITFNDSDWTILDQQIHGLLRARVREIGIVVGYEKDQIIGHITKNTGDRLSGSSSLKTRGFWRPTTSTLFGSRVNG